MLSTPLGRSIPVVVLLHAGVLAGCAKPQPVIAPVIPEARLELPFEPPPPPPLPPPPPPTGVLNLDGAARQVAAELARFRPPAAAATTLTIDPLMNGNTCEETQNTRRMQEALSLALPMSMNGLTVVPFVPDSLPSARLLVTGNIRTLDGQTHLVKVALTDRSSGQVVAQSAARFEAPTTDDAPTPFYRASRAVLCDQAALTEIETSERNAGEAASALYLEQLPTLAVLEVAQSAFDAGRWDEAFNGFKVASTRVDGKQLKTYAGLWTSQWNLGRTSEAEESYGEFARYALATNTLNVMLMFPPNRFDVFDPPRDAQIYSIMVRQIARASQELRLCLEVVGHTSRTGTDERNLVLSRQRADYVARALVSALQGRRFERNPRARGVGSAEALNGAPVDNDTTAVDRRVQFKVLPCGG